MQYLLQSCRLHPTTAHVNAQNLPLIDHQSSHLLELLMRCQEVCVHLLDGTGERLALCAANLHTLQPPKLHTSNSMRTSATQGNSGCNT
jgi:hypothetical protein